MFLHFVVACVYSHRILGETNRSCMSAVMTPAAFGYRDSSTLIPRMGMRKRGEGGREENSLLGRRDRHTHTHTQIHAQTSTACAKVPAASYYLQVREIFCQSSSTTTQSPCLSQQKVSLRLAADSDERFEEAPFPLSVSQCE